MASCWRGTWDRQRLWQGADDGWASAAGASPSGSAQHRCAGGDPVGNHVFSYPWEDHKVTTCTILGYQHLLAFSSSDADTILYRALEMRLIYWECQNEGKTWDHTVTCFSQLLQHQNCEFPHVPPSGHRGTTILERSPGTKAASLVQRGEETGWHPHRASRQGVTDAVSAIFILFLLSEAYHQEANIRGQSCAGRDGEDQGGWDQRPPPSWSPEVLRCVSLFLSCLCSPAIKYG